MAESRCHCFYERCLREHGSVRDFGTQFRTKSGEIRETRVSMELITLDEEPCILAIIHDVTERRRLWPLAGAVSELALGNYGAAHRADEPSVVISKSLP